MGHGHLNLLVMNSYTKLQSVCGQDVNCNFSYLIVHFASWPVVMYVP